MTLRSHILEFLEETFQTSSYPDFSYNGLQFDGKKSISRIISGVDGTVDFFKAAIRRKADMVIVHHGIFWKNAEWTRIDRFARETVEVLAKADLNVYAIHLPLDAHPVYGNNVLLAKAIGAIPVEPFGAFNRQKVGYLCTFKKSISAGELVNRVNKRIGPVNTHLDFGKDKIKAVGIVSGSGWDCLTDEKVYDGEIDAILTGEIAHQAVAMARMRKIHVIGAGHYATERYGVRALGEAIAAKFGIGHEFIDQPSGL